MRPTGSFVSTIFFIALTGTERKRAEASTADELAATATVRGLGLENVRPHLSKLRSAAFQLELSLNLHARGCLRLSSCARAGAAVGAPGGSLGREVRDAQVKRSILTLSRNEGCEATTGLEGW